MAWVGKGPSREGMCRCSQERLQAGITAAVTDIARKILSLIVHNDSYGATSPEIARTLGVSHQYVTARLRARTRRSHHHGPRVL
jgi:hypothetical protein